MKQTKKLVKNLLFEIGTEEIPSDYFETASESINREAPLLLDECGHEFEKLEVFFTPRRLVLFISDVFKKEVTFEEKFGPSWEQCYQNNTPTPALVGFLKSVGKKENDLEWKKTPKGKRACVSIKKDVKPLRYFFETLPLKVEFPKLMRWDSNFKFTRPIRWTFALVGKKLQEFKIGSLKSGKVTYGHRFFAKREIRVGFSDLNQYKKLLRKAHVILDIKERASVIRSFLTAAGNQDEALIHQVANLIEEPFPVWGVFKKEYLSLPQDVLSTCMRKHQKIFACYNSKGKLENRFLAVINGKRSDVKTIARNYENVLESRLGDARFFFHEDSKTKLEEKGAKLKELIFLGKLGSYLDKINRLRKLAAQIAENIASRSAGFDQDYPIGHIKTDADRTAALCKSDLMSHLVYEFPELQGIAGSEYALRDGENEWVSRGVKEHYYPMNLSQHYHDLQMMSPPAVLVSIADRIDLLVGALGIGIEPSGSKDPYALRRAAGGIVKLIRTFSISFSIKALVSNAVQLYGFLLKVDPAAIEGKIKSLLKDRMIFELDLKSGTKPYEIFLAVFESRSDDLADVYGRFFELSKIYEKNRELFFQDCKIVERTSNILKGIKLEQTKIEPSKFSTDYEKKLYELLERNADKISNWANEKNYAAASATYAEFYNPIHDFFEKVLVNDENREIRANRQALMKKINELYTQKIADLSLVTNP